MRAVQLPLQGYLTGTTVGQKQKLRRKPQYHCTHLSAGNCAGCFCHSPSKPCKKQKTLLSLLLIPVILILYFDTAYFGVVSFCYARSFSRNYLGLDGRCILLTTMVHTDTVLHYSTPAPSCPIQKCKQLKSAAGNLRHSDCRKTAGSKIFGRKDSYERKPSGLSFVHHHKI